MKSAILILFLIGAACANPVLHKIAMEMIQHASNSSESSSESSEQINTSEHSDEKSTENSLDSQSSESLESDSDETMSSESHSVESLIGKSETALTSDNTQSSKENVRRGWIYTLKWVHTNNNNKLQATSRPDDNNDIDTKSTSDASIKSESSESSESQETLLLNTKPEENGADTSESVEHNSVDASEYSNSNSSSSSSSSESTESKNSAVDSESRSSSTECLPGTDSQDCDSEEDFPKDIGDDGATDPFNGFLMPEVIEH